MLSAPLVHGAYRGGPSYEPGALLVMDFIRGRYRRGPGRGRVASNPAGVAGWQSVGHAGFGTTQVNGVYPPFAPDAPLIGDGGLLVPEARTNYAARPQNITAANGYVLTDVATSPTLTPGGELTFGDVSEVGATAVLRRIRVPAFSVTAAVAYTFSFRAKGGKARDFFAIRTSAQDVTSGFLTSVFNLATGAVSVQGAGQVARMIPEGGGWFRCSVQVTAATTGTADVFFGFPPEDIGSGLTLGAQTWEGDPAAGGYVWAYNNTVGPDINDPPILQTTGLPATRTACGIGVPQPTNTTQGTVVLEGLWPVWAGSSTEGVFLEPGQGASPSGFTLQTVALRRRPRVLFRSGAARIDASGGSDIEPGSLFRMALSWGSGAPVASFNGVPLISSGTPAQADFDPSHLLSVGSRGVGAGSFFANSPGLRSILWLPGQVDQARLDAATAL